MNSKTLAQETKAMVSETAELLKDDPRSIKAISEESGVNMHWLGKFHQGKFQDIPSVERIENLNIFLKQN